MITMAKFIGTAAANHIIGTAFADTISGLGGNDILEGRGALCELRPGALACLRHLLGHSMIVVRLIKEVER